MLVNKKDVVFETRLHTATGTPRLAGGTTGAGRRREPERERGEAERTNLHTRHDDENNADNSRATQFTSVNVGSRGPFSPFFYKQQRCQNTLHSTDSTVVFFFDWCEHEELNVGAHRESSALSPTYLPRQIDW